MSVSPRAVVVAALFAAVIGLAIWYLVKPEPLLVQGEAESTRIDIAARVSGRLAKIAVGRGQNVAARAPLLVIDNPELIAELREAKAEKTVADAELARIVVGTRAEIIALRKAEIDRAAADLTLAQQTYGRTRALAADQFAPRSKLDDSTATPKSVPADAVAAILSSSLCSARRSYVVVPYGNRSAVTSPTPS